MHKWPVQHSGNTYKAMPSFAPTKSSLCRWILALGLVGVVTELTSLSALSQTYYNPNAGGSMVQGGVTTGPPVDIPQTNLTPIAPPATTFTPSTGYGSFDPYASAPPATGGSIPGVTTIGPPTGGYPPAPSSSGSMFGLFSSPTAPPTGTIGYGAPTMAPVDNPSVYGATPYGAPPTGTVYGTPSAFPSSAYPQSTPSSLFPQGFDSIDTSTLLVSPAEYNAFRLFQGPRFRYTYVTPGNDPNSLGINDFDFSLAFAFPNFLWCTQPFFVVPSFSLHLWDGPNSPYLRHATQCLRRVC